MDNYFNYFTEIEEHFQRRRATVLLLSPLDWALMEMWKDAGIPLEAVLRGIDTTFDKWARRPRKTRKINGLAFCAQEVLASSEEMKDAAVGAPPKQPRDSGLGPSSVAAYLVRNADTLDAMTLPGTAQTVARDTSTALRSLAESMSQSLITMEDLERRLTVAEEKLFAALLAATPDDALYAARAEADRDLAPYRRKMSAPQIEQLHKQYIHKRLLEQYNVPRLSLFYM